MLYRKLLRDLWLHKGSNAAVIVVIAIGIMTFTSFSIAMDTLNMSVKSFYTAGKFPGGYVQLVSAPTSILSSVEKIKGIANAGVRIIEDVRLEDGFGATSNESKYIRLVSETENVGEFILSEGNIPQQGKNQVVIDPYFAEANQISVGDEIPIIAGGKKQYIEVCGIGRSPEYIYALRTAAQIYPDPVHFSTGFMKKDGIKRVTGKDSVTEVIYTVKKNYDKQEVKKNLEVILGSYGVINSYFMNDQMSNMMLTQELMQLKGTVVIMPMIFLSVSAMILFIMIGRMVEKQRGQIGILKAFGLKDSSIFLHYLSYSVSVSFIGGLVGVLWGIWLAKPLIELYKSVFNMPFTLSDSSWKYFLIGIPLSIFFGALSGIRASTKAAGLSPAEAMKSKSPDIIKSNMIEKSKLITNIFTTCGKMSLRNIFRNPSRSLFIFVGIIFTFSFAVMPWSFLRMTNDILFSNYDEVEKYNIKMYFNGFHDMDHIKSDLSSQRYIQRSEGFLEIPSTLIKNNIRENVSLFGIENESQLYTLRKGKIILYPPENTVILSERLAAKLNIRKGDSLNITSPLFQYQQEKQKFIVYEIVDQTVGMAAYTDIEQLGQLIGKKGIINAIIVRAPHGSANRLKEVYSQSSKITSVNDVRDMIGKMKKFIEGSMASMKFMMLISIAMGFAIIYNSYAIILSEREKEFASLLVLGMEEKQVISIVQLEQWLIAAFAIPIGIPLTDIMVQSIGKASSSDMFTINIHVDGISFITGAALTIEIIILAQLSASFKIGKIKISEALKSDE